MAALGTPSSERDQQEGSWVNRNQKQKEISKSSPDGAPGDFQFSFITFRNEKLIFLQRKKKVNCIWGTSGKCHFLLFYFNLAAIFLALVEEKFSRAADKENYIFPPPSKSIVDG